MVRLFGRDYGKDELLARVGDMAQLAGITSIELADGPERGVRALLFRTGSGFAFTVLLDRGMDVYSAELNGASLNWKSPTGAVNRLYYEAEGTGWQRGFFGGLVVTCGFNNVGNPNVDGGQTLGLHGIASYLPASRVCVETQWEGEDYVLRARGTMRQARAIGENLVWTRTVTAKLGESWLSIADVVENQSTAPTPLQFLYHCNPGFPVLDEGSRLVLPSSKVTPRDQDAEPGLATYAEYAGPRPGWVPQVFHHDLRGGPEGQAAAALVNPGFAGGRGLGLCFRWNKRELPHLWQWKMTGVGAYVTGVEPANCSVHGRAYDRAHGMLNVVQQGESRSFHLQIEALGSAAAIAAAEKEIKGL
ncbi:MAG: aldose 1-epimerase family protein [Chloroflexi bacterium]|nr:aldose 1-epimerase family protein [Chloroflexota bacterium]